jgi:hypothetical protein
MTRVVSKNNLPPRKGSLVVYHIPQVSHKATFYVVVPSVDAAISIINLLAEYDLFQYRSRIKGDYANTSGLITFDGKEWAEWENKDGYTISDIMRGA